MHDKIPLNIKSINAILTLRYNPFQTPIIPKLKHDDFLGTNYEPSIDYIENCIISTIKKTISEKNKKITVALSGGVDSTLLAAILKKNFPEADIEALSIKFAESVDETPGASSIAEYLDIKHRSVYLENYLIELPKAISIIKMPHWDLHWYHVVKNMSQNSKYLVSGDGGDELFGGYTFRYEKFLSLTNDSTPVNERIKSYLNCHERDWVPDQEKLFNKKIQFSWNEIFQLFKPNFDNKLSLINQVYLADFNGKLLFNMIPLYRKFHDHFKVKYAAPLLSRQLISLSTQLPDHLKYDKDKKLGKVLLQKILQKYEIDTFVTKEKQGFSVNTQNLWKKYGQKRCMYFLDESRIIRDGWINSEWVSKYIDNKDLEVRYVNKFLGLLALEIWYRIYITKEMNDDEKLKI